MFPARLNKYKSKLNETETSILKYLLQRQDEITDLTIKEIANDNYVSLNTIVWFAKKLDYANFTELKYSIYYSNLLLKDSETTLNNNSIDNPSFDLIRKTDESLNSKELSSIAHDIFVTKKCYAYGVDDSNYYAQVLAKNLLAVGKKIEVLDKSFKVDDVIKNSSHDELIIFLSASGETPVIVDLVNKCSQQDVDMIAITNNRETSISDKICKQINFEYQHRKENGINTSDLSGMSYAIMKFIKVYRDLFISNNL